MGALPRSISRLRLPTLPAWPVLKRRLIVAALVLLALTAAYLFWLRNSSLVAVEKVTITGAEQHPPVDAFHGLQGLRIAAQNRLIAFVRNAGDLQLQVVLIRPEPRDLGIGPTFAAQVCRRGLGLFLGVVYRLQSELAPE